MTKDEALMLALGALENTDRSKLFELEKIAITAIKEVLAQPVQPDLKTLVQKTHKAKGRFHNQIAMCDLYDACGLPNARPVQQKDQS